MATATTRHHISAIAMIIAMALAAACGKNDDQAVGDDALVRIDKHVLTRTALNRQMPAGLNPDDSAKYARAYIKAWIDAKVVSQFASREIDMAPIDEMVEQYRNDLIMWEYTRRMFDSHAPEIDEDSIRAYYDRHKSEFVLSRPMVKGVYLKVAEDSPSLPGLRKIYRSQKDSDIDNLDKSELNGAVHYDYFRDNWIDWEQIESRVPIDFGSSDQWLRSNDHLDTTRGGFTYLLNITDVLHTGQTMPYQAARPLIIDRLTFSERRAYEAELRKALFHKAQSKGKITIYSDAINY